MQIDINEVSFKITENRWLEIHVGEAEIVTIDTWDGGVTLGEGDTFNELGKFEEGDGTIDFVPAVDAIHARLLNLERKVNVFFP